MKKRFLTLILTLTAMLTCVFGLTACDKNVNNFNLSFKVDGEVYQTITTTGNESISIPENPTKTGYTFDGWFWDKDVWSKPFTANSLLDAPISSDMSVYAKFNAFEYDITYNVDGGTHSNPLSYTIEDSITLSAAEKIGYSFVGWYLDSNYNTKVEVISAGTTGDITLYAKFEIVNYTINYTNTKDAVNNNPTSYNVNSDAIALENLSKGGYTFNGWYNGEEKITEIAKESTGNLTLEARWTAIEYEVICHNVNGAINSNPENYNVEEQPLVLAVLEKAGYNFIGWFTDENFTNEITEISVGTTGEINLYAKWEAIEYTATFIDGTTVVEEIKFTLETESIDEPTVPNHVGYIGEWEDYTLDAENITINAVYTAIEYTATFMDGTTVVDEIKFTVETESIEEPAVPNHVGYIGEWEDYTLGAENITIDAVYTLIPYSIIYNNVDDATNTNPTTYNEKTQTIILVDAEKEGYTFLGWYSDEGFENEVVEITAGTVGNIELYAKWQRNEYTITFDSNGGTEVEFISEYYGVTIEEPTKPSKEKYYFVGWFLASGGNAYEFTTMPAENITLYARWEAYSLTLTYDETIQGVSSLKEITPESFGAKCVDNGGNLVDVSVTINGTVATGEIITVRLTSTSNGVIAQKTITNVRVYGMPTLTFDNTVDYVNINGGFTENHFGASGVDSFGKATNTEVYIDGEYEAGQIVTVTIASIDPAGNTVYGYVENVKAYGLPEITYNLNKTAISVNDTLNAELFNATAKDSFGESVAVIVSRYSGTISAGNTVIIRLSATDSKGNVTNINVECKVYGAPTITDSTVTEIKLSDDITAELLGISGIDTYGENLDITFTYDEKVAGEILTVTAKVTDIAGNVTTKDFKLKIYGAPTIIYNRLGLNVNEDAEKDASVLNVVAKDSFGNLLDVEVERKSESLIAGNYVVYTLTATDIVGNVTKLETAEIGVYDVNDIKLTYNAALTDKIKLSSKGEEFDAKATDSFGNACDISVEPAEGYTLAGGNIISLYLVATDKAGNKVCSDLIENIKVYVMPTVTFYQNSYLWDDNCDLDFLFTVIDSFNEELYATISEVETTDYYKVIRVQAQDDCDNLFDKYYTFALDTYTYTYTYYLNGGVNNLSNPTSYLDFVGEDKLGSIDLLEPTKVVSEQAIDSTKLSNGLFEVTYEITEYIFEGWFTDSDYTNEIKTISLEMGSLTLYAKWSAETRTTTTLVEEKAYSRIDENNNLSATGDYILFGEYPQTIKKESVTITSTQNSKGYYLGSDGNYYAKIVANVRGSDYKFSTGNTITDGATYYFKVEPIKWRILSESNGKALILCEMIIDAGAYDSSNNNYANSDIRAWLNNEFYNTAFNNLQKELILTTNVDNSARSTNPNNNATYFNNGVNNYACANTNDKVFLLSMQEVTNSAYGFNYSYYDIARRKQGTDYAKCNYLYVYTSSDEYYGNSGWRLRSPCCSSSSIAWGVNGYGLACNYNNVSYADLGVVPALKIQL